MAYFRAMNPALRRFIVFYRIPIAIVLIVLGLLLGFYVDYGWWMAWIPFLVAILMVVAHFLIGPMTLIQNYVEAGDMEGAKALLDRVQYPHLLYKPVRSSFYMLRSNLGSMNNNLDEAEADLRRSLETGMPEKDMEGTAYLQLGAIAMQKGNSKEAYEHLRKAVKLGIPDPDNAATAYLQLSSICIQRRDFRGAKQYFQKAKTYKAKNKEVIAQIAEMSKYMARIPG